MPFTPTDLYKNTRAALQEAFKKACIDIDNKLRSSYNGLKPVEIRITVDKALHESAMFDMIQTTYSAYGWDVTKKEDHGDMRDPYSYYYLVFKESHEMFRPSQTSGFDYFSR